MEELQNLAGGSYFTGLSVGVSSTLELARYGARIARYAVKDASYAVPYAGTVAPMMLKHS